MSTESEATYLRITWTVSRARDTYGYNVVTLVDTATGKRYRASGGGYDMKGTVFGEWLQDTQQEALRRIADRAHQTVLRSEESPWDRLRNALPDSLYGMTNYPATTARVELPEHRVSLDGACGFDAMRRIAEAIGLSVRAMDQDRNGNAGGYLVERAAGVS